VRVLALIVLPVLLTASLIDSADAQPASAEFLVFERPDRLRIYDRFEQYVSDPASRGLTPFAAVQVVSERGTLGDGITPVMAVRINGEAHYLVRDPESGGLVGERDLGSVTRVRNARAYWDSLEIIAPAGVTFTPASGGRRRTLGAGTPVYRLFSSGGRTYVRTLDASVEHGWLGAGPEADGTLWRRPKRAVTDVSGAASELIDRIRERVRETNLLISGIYAAVERESSRRLQAPQWRVDVDGSAVRCSLAPVPADSARISTVLLGKHIESLTLGTRYRVHTSPGLIEVRP
jgi:hypothetical protein